MTRFDFILARLAIWRAGRGVTFERYAQEALSQRVREALKVRANSFVLSDYRDWCARERDTTLSDTVEHLFTVAELACWNPRRAFWLAWRGR